MCRIEPFFPLSHGIPRVHDRRTVSGIVHMSKRGLMWCGAPKRYGPHKRIYSRLIRWRKLGVFNRIIVKLAGKTGEPDAIMIDGTDLKAHRMAANLLIVGLFPTYRANQEWIELEAPFRLKWAWQTDHRVAQRQLDERLQGCPLLRPSLATRRQGL